MPEGRNYRREIQCQWILFKTCHNVCIFRTVERLCRSHRKRQIQFSSVAFLELFSEITMMDFQIFASLIQFILF